MPAFKRKPSRADVARSIQQISLLWAKPRPPDKEKAAEGLAPEAAFEVKLDTADSTLAGDKCKGQQ